MSRTDSSSVAPIWFAEAPSLEALNDFIRERDAVGYMGLEFTEIGADFMRARLPLGPKVFQTFGLLNGGVSCVVAETMGSIMANKTLDPSRKVAVGIEINASHLGSASGEGHVTAVTRPIRVGGTLQVTETRIFNQTDDIVCIVRLTTIARNLPGS